MRLYVHDLKATAMITVMSGFSNVEVLGLSFVVTSIFKITKYKYNRTSTLFLCNSYDLLIKYQLLFTIER